jgi:hypothetical protein
MPTVRLPPEPVTVRGELLPDGAVAAAARGEALAVVRRIEGREVPQLHGHAVRVPEPGGVGPGRLQGQGVERLAQLDHLRRPVVADPDPRVQLEGEDQLLARPQRVPSHDRPPPARHRAAALGAQPV